MKRTRLRKRRPGPPRRGPERDPKHLAMVRTMPCCACSAAPPSDPNHDTHQRGLGQKASDYRTIPMCRRCHDHWHAGTGRFKSWDKAERRAWFESQLSAVAATLALALAFAFAPGMGDEPF